MSSALLSRNYGHRTRARRGDWPPSTLNRDAKSGEHASLFSAHSVCEIEDLLAGWMVWVLPSRFSTRSLKGGKQYLPSSLRKHADTYEAVTPYVV